MTQIKLQKHNFDGPLDLLLSLIEDKKLNISEIAIAEVTEQFLAHIRSLEAKDPAVLADFLAIAAKLLVIKSKTLLPELVLEASTEDPDPARDLESRLLVYKQFRDLAKGLKKLSLSPTESFSRSLNFTDRVNFFPDPKADKEGLRSAILKIMQNLREMEEIPKAKVREVISIQEKIAHLQTFLAEKLETKLSLVLQNAKTKHEAIVTFLALLELIKQRILTVDQEASFADITIRKLETENASVIEY